MYCQASTHGVESLYELRDLIDYDDAHGSNVTPLGRRSLRHPPEMGTWTATTAMGALTRGAAAFGVLDLPPGSTGGYTTSVR